MDDLIGVMRRFALAALSATMIASVAHAASGIEVKDAWARATVPGQTVGGIYLQIRSSTPARVVRVTSPDAKSAEIHEMKMQGGVMTMRQLGALELPAGETVKLEPGGYHIMLLDIRKPLKSGEHVRLTLVVERKGKETLVPVVAEVKPIAQ